MPPKKVIPQQWNWDGQVILVPPAPIGDFNLPPQGLQVPGYQNQLAVQREWYLQQQQPFAPLRIRDLQHPPLQDPPEEQEDEANGFIQDFPDPGPRPEFLKRPEGLSLDETIKLNQWKKDRIKYLKWLSKQPEPLRGDYILERSWHRAYDDWVEAGGAMQVLPQKIPDPDREIKKLKPRGEATPRFSLPYSPEEMKLRLRGTIVVIDDRPCYVQQAGENVRDSDHKGVISPGLFVLYSDGSGASIVPRLHTLDFRPFEPGYIQRHPGLAELYVRHPARIFRQGIHPENSRIFDAVTLHPRPIPADSRGICALLKTFEDRNDTLFFSKEIIEDLTGFYKEAGGAIHPSIRLSNKVVACIKDKTQKIHILFKGISCCVFDQENPRFDKNFCSLPSVSAELLSVNIK